MKRSEPVRNELLQISSKTLKNTLNKTRKMRLISKKIQTIKKIILYIYMYIIHPIIIKFKYLQFNYIEFNIIFMAGPPEPDVYTETDLYLSYYDDNLYCSAEDHIKKKKKNYK